MIKFPVVRSMSSVSINFVKFKSSLKEYVDNNTITSTPVVSEEKRSINHKENVIKKVKHDMVSIENQLLDCKDSWPLSFSEASQQYLNNLGLSIENDFLCHDSNKHQSRLLQKTQNFLRKSVSRDRSQSPGGEKNGKCLNWDKNVENLILLINEIMFNLKDFSNKGLFVEKYDKEVKELINSLKNKDNTERIKIIHEYPKFILIQCLKFLLEKLGLIIPQIISEQFLIIKVLIETRKDDIRVNSGEIKAVQTMLFNITKQSRSILKKVLILFNNLFKIRSLGLSKSKLAKWLRPSLFRGIEDDVQLKFCRDLITFSNEIFNAPEGLLELVNEKLNSRMGNAVMIKVSSQCSPPQPTTSNIKSNQNDSSITLQSYRVISSPERHSIQESPNITHKRHSLTEMTKKICKRAFSPLKPMKGSYNIENFYLNTKRTRNGEK